MSHNIGIFVSHNIMKIIFSDHVNYFGLSEAHGPMAISMQREKTEAGSDRSDANYQYRIIIRSAKVTFH